MEMFNLCSVMFLSVISVLTAVFFSFPCLQLGLFVDFNPEEMLLGAEDGEDDGDLEAELAAITGARVKEGKAKPKGKSKLKFQNFTY